ncbi:MAG: hypothetical protein LC797_10795, partial [Chloroflexi bacterium]|nr:hypothetical protein [Chloroflexota bacterium]
MNTRTVDPRTIWAVLAMEAGLILPIISVPAQGDRIAGVLGPLLLLVLLLLGFVSVLLFGPLRDPSWRLLTAIAAALLTRLVVASVPAPGMAGLALWLGHSFVPAAIGVALWWRGGALCVAELTAAEVRTEFSVLAVCMLAVLALVRPFLLPDPVLLAGSVALFAAGGLLATALARQDAAQITSAGSGRTLAITTALMPIGMAVILVSILRPAVVGVMWTTLGRIIELVLTPLGWLLAWLASLLPRGGPPAPLPPLIRPTPQALPDPAALGDLQDRMEWIRWVALITLLIAATIAALIVARLLLANWIGTPPRAATAVRPDLTVERSGTAGGTALGLWGWLRRWVRGRFGHRPPPGATRGGVTGAAVADAWAAYRALLHWA